MTAGEVEKLTGLPSVRVAKYTKNGSCTYMQYRIGRSGKRLSWEELFRLEWQDAVEQLKGGVAHG